MKKYLLLLLCSLFTLGVAAKVNITIDATADGFAIKLSDQTVPFAWSYISTDDTEELDNLEATVEDELLQFSDYQEVLNFVDWGFLYTGDQHVTWAELGVSHGDYVVYAYSYAENKYHEVILGSDVVTKTLTYSSSTPEPTQTTYTITFVNYDGTVLQTSEVEEGTMPSYAGTTPTKPEDASFTYTFSGWSPAISPATANATYTATFTATSKNAIITYTASEKLAETTSSSVAGIHTNAFSVSIMSHTFADGVGTITFSGDVTFIGNEAFSGCDGLTSITIPESVTSIGDYAFSWCTSLTSITIPEAVTSIGDNAFWNCTSLTSITIPESVTSIGDYAFWKCSSLTSITIPSSVTSIGDGVFNGCSGLTSITIPESVTSIGKETFSECYGLTAITIPSSLTSIGDYAFYWCTSLTSITCEAVTPPTCGTQCFLSVPTTIPVYVPCEAKVDYKAANEWKNFTNIQPIDGTCPTTYTITFVNYDGTVLQTSTVEEGTMPAYTDTTPVRPEDASFTYTFSGWSPAVVAATANATYTATFTATPKSTPLGSPELCYTDGKLSLTNYTGAWAIYDRANPDAPVQTGTGDLVEAAYPLPRQHYIIYTDPEDGEKKVFF